MITVGAEDASDNTCLVVMIDGVRDTFQNLVAQIAPVVLVPEDR